MSMLPWSSVVFPPVGVSQSSVMAIPGVGRAVGLLSGLIRQMRIDEVRGAEVMPRPRFFEKPDPTPGNTRSWFVGVQCEDYLLNGNAVHLVTSRSANGRPMSALWIPSSWVSITEDPQGQVKYWCRGAELPTSEIVHVKRGADRTMPRRGVGVVEQHVRAFTRMDEQERYETEVLRAFGVPSVVIQTPNPDLSQEEADEAATGWIEKYRERRPAVLPAGTTVTPLAWSPDDAQMVEGRKLSLQDVANIFNMDGVWVGAPAAGLTYKNLATMYLNLLTQTLDPILSDFQGVWSEFWLPPNGREVRFDRSDLLHSDMETDVGWLGKAMDTGLFSREEARAWVGYPPMPKDDGAGEDATLLDAEIARAAAEVSQKVYLAVANKVLTRDEGRDLIGRAGAVLTAEGDKDPLPEPVGVGVGDEGGTEDGE